MSEVNIKTELQKAPVEPLLPIEKKLIGWSLGIGIVSLVVLALINRIIAEHSRADRPSCRLFDGVGLDAQFQGNLMDHQLHQRHGGQVEAHRRRIRVAADHRSTDLHASFAVRYAEIDRTKKKMKRIAGDLGEPLDTDATQGNIRDVEQPIADLGHQIDGRVPRKKATLLTVRHQTSPGCECLRTGMGRPGRA